MGIAATFPTASRSRDGQLYHLVLTKIGRKQPDCRAS
jgi:hypothetical protein